MTRGTMDDKTGSALEQPAVTIVQQGNNDDDDDDDDNKWSK